MRCKKSLVYISLTANNKAQKDGNSKEMFYGFISTIMFKQYIELRKVLRTTQLL